MDIKAIRTSARASAAVLFGFGAISFATSASAACGDTSLAHPAAWQAGQNGTAGLLRQADFAGPPIVGMWSFKQTVGGAVADFGYQQWHSDGTEEMNSGTRAPSTQNFCMGVWRQTGGRSYHLTHYALSYDGSTGQMNANVIIKEDVTVNPSGTSYSGPFTIDVYEPNTNHVLQHVAGQVTGQRVANN